MTIATAASVCPHDCPSACALEVEILPGNRIGRVHGGSMPYVDGVICAKVARYAERVHNPDRILHPLRRIGAKGEGRFAPISWDEALDEIATRLAEAGARLGPETVWPYFYAGTMGLVQQSGINRLRRVMGWSGQAKTICSAAAGAGWMAGIGAKWGVSPGEIAQSGLVVVWGANPASTQVQLMGLIKQARSANGARLVVVDPYRTQTAAKADLHLMLRPGTDGALAVAVMHVLFRDNLADRDYLARYTDCPERLERHLESRTPQWAAAITGLEPAEIEAFAALYGSVPNSFLRVGYGFARSRNGSANLHAVSCLPAVTGAWRHKGGGAMQTSGGVFGINRTLLDGLDVPQPKVRTLDMSRIGPILAGDPRDLQGGPMVTAMLVQNTNPANVAPESGLVRQGLARDDLFLAVHEQTLTATARFADIVLPATTSMEHADLYTSYGHTFLQMAMPVIEPLGQARPNHRVIRDLAARLGAVHPGFEMDEIEMIDQVLRSSDLPGADELRALGWLNCAKVFEDAHFLSGFGHEDGRFRFAPDWNDARMPALPDHMAVIDEADADHPFRLITPPSLHFLNSTFAETETSRRLAGEPAALVHEADCAALGLADGGMVRIGNIRGSVVVRVRSTAGIARGVVAVESIWPDECFAEGRGINHLTSADAALPAGGAVFHDTRVWLRGESG
ncbi:molybdopterin oxidoreductase family protein [Magnetospirillum sp. SS-4]|uniref:molybdopterin oxidoreductase family protein n=1 Tax=Magnetospirillum sp. SS-4 TaxID=2681465 RepID=UPI00137D9B21|nr:molybdopterin oxidoreductase family protein [Magnetospirillum sp. SS-4]CAA7613010.1 Anaerobic dehydrogenase [Magnetospirillum sp. SS-4]